MKTIKLMLSVFLLLQIIAVSAQDSLFSEPTSNEPCCSTSIVDTLGDLDAEEFDIEIAEDGTIIENPMDKFNDENTFAQQKQARLKQHQGKEQSQSMTQRSLCCA